MRTITKMFHCTINKISDVNKIENQLRNVYNVYPGEPCQFLMTTEYIRWKNEVKKRIQNPTTVPTYVDTFLPGYHICFESSSCQIVRTTPTLPVYTNIENDRMIKRRKCASSN